MDGTSEQKIAGAGQVYSICYFFAFKEAQFPREGVLQMQKRQLIFLRHLFLYFVVKSVVKVS